ncbi:hypothetical protein [Pseudopelagicola sp. nBUS_19]|uniref:hypothetical protein n=1 Tax=Pseudopelagicola sp. nBUS_19 TaxID=3395316 RepID=UPI003EBA6FA5
MKKNKDIGVLIGNRERCQFFLRRIALLKDDEFIFYHSNLYSYFWSKFHTQSQIKHRLLKYNNSNVTIRCIETYHSRFNAIFALNLNLIEKTHDEFWLFNGFQSVASQIYNMLKCETFRFFEIGNCPNKYQVNTSGINADACLTELSEIKTGFDSHLASLTAYIPPHTKRKLSGAMLEYVFNTTGSKLFKTAAPRATILGTIRYAIEILKTQKLLRDTETSNCLRNTTFLSDKLRKTVK